MPDSDDPAKGRVVGVEELSESQRINLNRFEAKLPKSAGSTVIEALPGKSVAFEAVVPGRVPGSHAVYRKTVDHEGTTIAYTKVSIDPAGTVIHIKDKY